MQIRHLNRFIRQTIMSVAVLCLMYTSVQADNKNKILYINSYHEGYQWSDGILRGIKSRLVIENVWFKTYYMDSLRNAEPEKIKESVKKIKTLIDNLEPDVVIISDENAVKHILTQHYKNSKIPFVFSGMNWDASIYGLPFENTTGIIGIAMVSSIVDLLQNYSKGNRIGLLARDTLPARKNADHYQKKLGKVFSQIYFTNTFDDWKKRFLELQKQSDLIILDHTDGLKNWQYNKAIKFIHDHASVPIGTMDMWMSKFGLITIAKYPEEQGWWTAELAIKILNGTPPNQITIEKNKRAKLFINMSLANQLGITFSPELLEIGEIVGKSANIEIR